MLRRHKIGTCTNAYQICKQTSTSIEYCPCANVCSYVAVEREVGKWIDAYFIQFYNQNNKYSQYDDIFLQGKQGTYDLTHFIPSIIFAEMRVETVETKLGSGLEVFALYFYNHITLKTSNANLDGNTLKILPTYACYKTTLLLHEGRGAAQCISNVKI